MTIPQLKVVCLAAVLSVFTLTACPSGQGTSASNYGSNPPNGSSLGGPGTSSSGSMGGAAGAAGAGAGGR